MNLKTGTREGLRSCFPIHRAERRSMDGHRGSSPAGRRSRWEDYFEADVTVTSTTAE